MFRKLAANIGKGLSTLDDRIYVVENADDIPDDLITAGWINPIILVNAPFTRATPITIGNNNTAIFWLFDNVEFSSDTPFIYGDYSDVIITSFGEVVFEVSFTSAIAGTVFNSPTKSGSVGSGVIGCTCSGTPEMTLFNLATDDDINGAYGFVEASFIYGFGALGTIGANTLFDSNFVAFNGIGQGFTFNGCWDITFSATVMNYWNNDPGTVMLSFYGDNTSISVVGFTFSPQANESIFYIDTASTMFLGGTVVGGNVKPLEPGGAIFAPGSKTQSDPDWDFRGLTGLADSTVSAEAIQTLVSPEILTVNAQNQKIIVTSDGWSGDTVERVDIGLDGSVLFTGIEPTIVSLDRTLRLDPTTSQYLLQLEEYLLKSASETVVTFDNVTDTVIEIATPRQNGDVISFYDSAGTMPTGLRKDVLNFVINKTTDSFQVSRTLGGVAVTFTDNGSGTNSYKIAESHGSKFSENAQNGTPLPIDAKALIPFEAGDKSVAVASNIGSAVNIRVNTNGYLRVKK